MGRQAKPYVWRDWFVTEAGGQGIHKLCPVSEGFRKAKTLLKDWLDQCRKEKQERETAGLVDVNYTVRQLAALFLRHKEVTKPKSFRFYKRAIKSWVEECGDMHIRKLRLSHGDDFLAKLRDRGLANATINRRVGTAKSALHFAVDREFLLKNPWRKLPKLPERERHRIVTQEEFDKLLRACDKCIAYKGRVDRGENADLMRDLLYVLRYTALRPGELRLLRCRHIKLDPNEPVGFIEIPAEEHKTGSTAKIPQSRLVPVLSEARAILLKRIANRQPDDFVFPNLLGAQWTDSVFSKRFAMLRRRAGLDTPDGNGECLVWYSLRHTRLTEIGGPKEKWPFPVVQRSAGHARGSRVTMRYMQTDQDDLARAALEGENRRKEASKP